MPVASYRRIEVKPIAGALGAEIRGVDLATLDDDTFVEIEAAWLEHLVVFFRRQAITPEQQIAFAGLGLNIWSVCQTSPKALVSLSSLMISRMSGCSSMPFMKG